MRARILLAAAASVIAVTACSSGGGAGGDASSAAPKGYDVSSVQKVDEIANLLPQAIKDKGKLTIGASTDYAPAEFRSDDLNTPIGYDVDLGKAIGKVLGVEATVEHGQFDSLLPGIGSKYDLGISSFTITEERTASYNMVAYISVGSSYAVKRGNPQSFDPADVCGKAIAVQTGTWQETELSRLSGECTATGKSAIEVLSYAKQSDATTNVAGGKAVAFFADSTVSSYAAKLSDGGLEVVGDVIDSAPQGIVVAQQDKELTAAVQKAVQHLMDDGTWKKILAEWGNESAALDKATLYPES